MLAFGYHAIKFLLRGPDFGGTGPEGTAAPIICRPTDLLVANLEEMTSNWAEGGAPVNGSGLASC